MRKRVPKMKKGGPYMSDMDRKIAASKRKTGKSKRLRKAQPGTEMMVDVTGYNYPVVNTKKTQIFNPMFRGDGPGTTNYVAQVFGTGADDAEGHAGRGSGLGGLSTRTGTFYSGFPGAPNPSMYGGNQRKYIRALNKFGRQTAKDYRDLYTGGRNPSRISTSRLGDIPGAEEYQKAYDKLYGYIDSEIADIDQANQNVGNSRRNKRTKGKGNKNRLFR